MHTPRHHQTRENVPSPPPRPQHPQWAYTHDDHEGEEEDYPSAPPTPPYLTAPAASMPEPEPIPEHPEYTHSPSPVDPAAHQVPATAPAVHAQHADTLPPLPAAVAMLAVPTAVRLPESAPTTPSATAPPPVLAPILAPTPGVPRAVMSPSLGSPTPITPTAGPSRQPRQGTSSDESQTEEHVLLQRPAAQARPRIDQRRAVSSIGHAAHASDPIAYPARTLSYSAAPGRQRRQDRPTSAGLTGVGPDPYSGVSRRSTLDYVVPAVEGGSEKRDSKMGLSFMSARENTVGERLRPTILHAQEARIAAKRKARVSGYALNVCIGLQVVLGAITTGVAAASTTSRTSTSVGIPILGGLSTLAASYLARSRGSGEPEKSIVRAHDLDHFIRDAEAFLLDRGHLVGTQYDADVQRYRVRFEEIMGHVPRGNQATDAELGMQAQGARAPGASADGLLHAALGQQGQGSPMAPAGQIPTGYAGHGGQGSPVANVAPMGYNVNQGGPINVVGPPGQMAYASPVGYTGYMGSQMPMAAAAAPTHRV